MHDFIITLNGAYAYVRTSLLRCGHNAKWRQLWSLFYAKKCCRSRCFLIWFVLFFLHWVSAFWIRHIIIIKRYHNKHATPFYFSTFRPISIFAPCPFQTHIHTHTHTFENRRAALHRPDSQFFVKINLSPRMAWQNKFCKMRLLFFPGGSNPFYNVRGIGWHWTGYIYFVLYIICVYIEYI